MSLDRVVIVGGGQAGFQAAVSLRQNKFEGSITIVGDEPGLPYQKPPLSKAYLKGDIGLDLLLLRPENFFGSQRIELITGARVNRINRIASRVVLDDKRELPYDHLILATGARNRVLALPGTDLEGVWALRDLKDTDGLRGAMPGVRRAVVIGAGFIGLEFAAVARSKGIDVTVLEVGPRPMARAVSSQTSEYFRDWHARQGVKFRFGVTPTRILGEVRHAVGVELRDGECIPADLVLIAAGVVPNVELAADADLAIDNGILVNPQLLTQDPEISAIGDCASYPNVYCGQIARLESVQNAVDQARNVAARLTGKPTPYVAVPWFWSDQGDQKLQIVGLCVGYNRTVVRGHIDQVNFSVFCYRDDKLIAIESVNRPADHMQGRRLVAAARSPTPDQVADEAFDLKGLVDAAA